MLLSLEPTSPAGGRALFLGHRAPHRDATRFDAAHRDTLFVTRNPRRQGYDATDLRDAIRQQGATPVIPPRKTSPPVACDYALYCERNLVERFFLKIKHFRRILAMLAVVGAFIWTKRMSTRSRAAPRRPFSIHRGTWTSGGFQPSSRIGGLAKSPTT
jgi:transposase